MKMSRCENFACPLSDSTFSSKLSPVFRLHTDVYARLRVQPFQVAIALVNDTEANQDQAGCLYKVIVFLCSVWSRFGQIWRSSEVSLGRARCSHQMLRRFCTHLRNCPNFALIHIYPPFLSIDRDLQNSWTLLGNYVSWSRQRSTIHPYFSAKFCASSKIYWAWTYWS